VIGCFVDLGGNDYYGCLELIGCFVDLWPLVHMDIIG
jgi:hypothetical protein